MDSNALANKLNNYLTNKDNIIEEKEAKTNKESESTHKFFKNFLCVVLDSWQSIINICHFVIIGMAIIYMLSLPFNIIYVLAIGYTIDYILKYIAKNYNKNDEK